jgi:chitodextrinase
VEYVHDVQAMLILPEEAILTSGVNPFLIGEMPPYAGGGNGGPADASCNWTIVFKKPGTYTLIVNASCLDTQYMPRWMINSTTVEVYDYPYVEFAYLTKVYINQTIILNATKSHAYGPECEIISYQWNFGDGTNTTTASPVVEHEFRQAGNYTVSLKVTDNRGLSNVTTGSLRVVLFGDINLDNAVNILDLSLVASSFGSVPGDEKWNDECDLNKDSVINIIDVSLVAKEYGSTG